MASGTGGAPDDDDPWGHVGPDARGVFQLPQSPVQHRLADLRTGTGEIRDLRLTEGTRLVLSSATAVDVLFDAEVRRLHRVGGEILVESATEPPAADGRRARPFVVETIDGRVRPTDLLAELGRYRSGVLRCHPGDAQLRVSGTFSVIDTDRTLAVLQQVLPIRISSVTPYWISVAAR